MNGSYTMRSDGVTAMLDVEKRVVLLFQTLYSRYPDRTAAPFLSAPPADYDPGAVTSILYVGKATETPWGLESFLRSPTATERRNFTAEFLKRYANTGEYTSAFWRFAHDLSVRLALATHHEISKLQNLVWTNLFKIGVVRGTPNAAIRNAQIELSTEYLRLEIKVYRPKLIVLVTGDYAGGVVTAVFGEQGWEKERQRDGYWWRSASGSLMASY